ncbi:enoyl-CoA hydratase/isomerase family protein [Microvirga pudoricolor]|uniref:enoyl-CoA hydratase/isomerase family protein n=1 Tax=Microvirga pudoricolor TaxID=2778729 RepID=UPI0019503E70|nr:enoyl-CoA hydratase/isomerase family protein [Microvirga pudoricolor]MBM6594862.1 enoyl-CoA hydratase/isomerase family protein [Microvirga pudoricolor]
MSIECDLSSAGIATVTLSNPARRNALTLDMFTGLAGLWSRLAADRSVRVVVVTGAGEEAFCSGADLSADLASEPGIDDLIAAAFLKTLYVPMPVIAAINGVCVAGGLEIALGADIRLASETARLGLPEVRWGIMPSGGAAMKLADQIGQAHAMDLLLSGRLIGAQEAERIGLVSSVLPSQGFRAAAMDFAGSIARNSPVAVRAAKKAAMLHRVEAYREREAAEREMVAQVRGSGHPRIGIEAFLAKRQPVFPDE